ncbi:MAG: FAD-dependent thymidylate synthase [Simkaniaceae bacterium]|nr:FAD-dependent thymidylate synthase [Simkaniaceae bacterium]MCF7852149.1 FAD-dependent thymidylate synthase [Simkaniaceae bacterium]
MLENYEEFSESQIKILEKFVSNTSSNVFALRNLPEVIKGALFSRYSRSCLGLRSLLLKEFILNDETAFQEITNQREGQGQQDDQVVAIKKAQNFYDRILDGYGDDSIGELGGAHLACENVSMLAAKEIEDCRIGGSPLEKSTRYIYFDQKVDGDYLFYKEQALMTSAYREEYLQTCQNLFETYGALIPPLTQQMEQVFPKDESISKVAYTAALRAKVLDCIRGLLPSSTLTNLGLFGNGRFFETLLQRLSSHSLLEFQDIGHKGFEELSKIIPSFVRRSQTTHKHYTGYVRFKDEMQKRLRELTEFHTEKIPQSTKEGVQLISYSEDAPKTLAAALLYHYSPCALSDLKAYANGMTELEREQLFETVSATRTNRRHKSPRALEQVYFTFDILADFGVYRDLQRHRMLSQERQLLTCDYGYYVPKEVVGTPMEKVYCDAIEQAKAVYDKISIEFPEEAQYVVPMAYNIRWYFHINLRALQWMCELRSSPQGHPSYRLIAQEMAQQVIKEFPEFAPFFKFVDFEGYDLGRLDQEIRTEKRLNERQIFS